MGWGPWQRHRQRQAGKYAKKSYQMDAAQAQAELGRQRQALVQAQEYQRQLAQQQQALAAQEYKRRLAVLPENVPTRPDVP